MTVIQLRCPTCSTLLSIAEGHAGQTGTCHFCGGKVTAPASPGPVSIGPTPLIPMPPGGYGGAVSALPRPVVGTTFRSPFLCGLGGFFLGAAGGVIPGGIVFGILLSVLAPGMFAG